MKRESYRHTTNAYYENRAASRPRQVWKKAKIDGQPSRRFAAANGEIGAIPVHVNPRVV
jgi:hypothetical protein